MIFLLSSIRGNIHLVRILGMLIATAFLTSCVPANMSLATEINPLGGGHHEMILALPVAQYSPDLLSKVPDFSLITGVRVEDYRGPEGRGIRVRQRFLRLGRLNGPAEKAIFLNKAFSGSPIAFQTKWEPGFLTRGLIFQAFVNAYNSESMSDAVARMALSAMQAQYTVTLPGEISAHNGTQVGDDSVEWAFQLDKPQTLSASTQDVPNYPMWASLLFSMAGIVFAGGALFGRTVTHASTVRRGSASRSRRLGPARRPPVRPSRR